MSGLGNSLLTSPVLVAGLAMSGWLIPGQWALILVFGVAVGLGAPSLSTMLHAEPITPRAAVSDELLWAFEANFLVGSSALASAVLLWVTFGSGEIYSLFELRPFLASGTAFLVGAVWGLTAYVAFNRRKLISK